MKAFPGQDNAMSTAALGASAAFDLWTPVEGGNQAVGLDLRFRYENNASSLMRRNDRWPFNQRGVPGV